MMGFGIGPEGYDETYNSVCGNKAICENMYKCRNMLHRCLHIASVCDGYSDCYFADDELLCSLKMIRCPVKCKCLIFAINCRNVSPSDILLNLHTAYVSVHISYSNIFSISTVQKKLLEATIIKLPSNALEDVCKISLFNKLLLLDLSFNCIKEIKRNCFSSSNTLKVLLVNNNKIRIIGLDSFTNFKKLLFINISNNPLANLPSTFLKSSPYIKILNAADLTLRDIVPEFLIDSNIRVIVTSIFLLCCAASGSNVCLTSRPWYMKCSFLLPKGSMGIFFIVISSLIVIINGKSILLHLLIKTSNFSEAFTAIAIFNNINNFLFALYLTII